jgi:MFS family permease
VELRVPSTFQPLATRAYRLAFCGAVLSNTGTWMQNVAVQWLVYQQTGSAAWVGLATFAQFIPLFLAGPVGGVLADRWDRKRLLLGAQSWMMGWSVLLAVLTLTGVVTAPLVVCTVLALGFGFAFHGPTWQTVVPHLVPREQLTQAIALNSAQMATARILGPALGGVLIPFVGAGGVFVLNAISYVAVLVAIAMLRLPAREPGERSSILGELRGGVRYARTHRELAWLIGAVLAVSLCAAPLVALLPVYAEDVLGGGARTLGMLMACLGAGSLVGALLLGELANRFRTPALVGGALILLGSATLLVALAPLAGAAAVGATAAAVMVTGGFRLVAVSASNSRLQLRADDLYRGRVLSLMFLAFGGAFPIGALAAGAAADVVGVQWVTALLGVLTVVSGALIGGKLARHDRLAR